MLGKRPETFEKMHVVKVFRGIESSMSVISLKFISRTNVFVNLFQGCRNIIPKKTNDSFLGRERAAYYFKHGPYWYNFLKSFYWYLQIWTNCLRLVPQKTK